MIKKLRRFVIIIFIFLFIRIVLANLSGGWIYVKFNGNLYVANTEYSEAYAVKEKVGTIQEKIFKLIKPYKNNQSNGFPVGTELYSTDNQSELIVKYIDKYYLLQDVEKTVNARNGAKVKIK